MGVRRGERGQALVELGLALPLLLLTLLGGADLARVFAFSTAVETAARTGAESASIDPDPTLAEVRDLVEGELSGVPGLDPLAATVTLTVHRGDDVDGSCAPVPTLAVPCFATVRVQYTFRPVIAWPGLPASVELDRTRSFRRSQ